MKRAYLFIYDNEVGARAEVKGVLDRMNRVTHWRFDIPNVFYVVSDHSAQELYEEFIAKNSKKGKFMFIEAGDNRQGQMLKATWHFLRHKRYMPKND